MVWYGNVMAGDGRVMLQWDYLIKLSNNVATVLLQCNNLSENYS